jgi:O-antigen/teichoic acid export membrane protein
LSTPLKRNALWQLVQTVSGTGAELAILLLFAAQRSPPEFGALALALSATKLVFLLCEPRIHEFLTPKLARYLDRSRRGAWVWVRLARRAELTLNLLALCACIALATVVPMLSQSVGSALVAACALYTCANTFLKFSSLSIFRCLGEIRTAALHTVVASVLKLGILGVCLQTGASAALLVLLLAIPTALVGASNACVAVRRLAQRAGPMQAWQRRKLRSANQIRQLRLVFSNYATGLVDIGHRELDMQVAGWLAGATEAGRYRLAKTLAMCVLEALNPVVLVLLPELSRRLTLLDRAALAAFVRRTSAVLAAIGLVAGLLTLGAAAIYLHFFAKNYAESWLPLLVLLAGFVLIAPSMWAQAYLVAAGRPDVYLRASSVGAIVALGLAWMWVGRWGALGSAFAHCTGLAASNVLALLAATSHLRDQRRGRAEA